MEKSKATMASKKFNNINFTIKSQGFSLLEILIVTAIFSLIMGAVYTVLTVGQNSYYVDTKLLDLMEQERNALDRMEREIRAASSISITNSGAAITFNTPTTTGIQYSLSNNQLIRTVGGTSNVIAYRITSLLFTSNTSSLDIQLQSSQTINNRTVTFSMKERLKLRNG